MWIVHAIGKWSLLFFSFGIGITLFITLIFSMVKVGERADEGEERILDILSSEGASSDAESETAQLAEVSIAE